MGAEPQPMKRLDYVLTELPGSQERCRELDIRLTEVRGTSPVVAAGGRFLVRGEYALKGAAIDHLVLSSLGRSSGEPAPLSQGAGTFEATAQILAVEAGRERVLDLVMIGRDGTDLGVCLRIELVG